MRSLLPGPHWSRWAARQPRRAIERRSLTTSAVDIPGAVPGAPLERVSSSAACSLRLLLLLPAAGRPGAEKAPLITEIDQGRRRGNAMASSFPLPLLVLMLALQFLCAVCLDTTRCWWTANATARFRSIMQVQGHVSKGVLIRDEVPRMSPMLLTITYT